MNEDKRILSRPVEATLIPQGTPMELAEGENVVITHRLGGNFTIMTENGMFRIKGSDADALGEEVIVNEKNSDENHSEKSIRSRNTRKHCRSRISLFLGS